MDVTTSTHNHQMMTQKHCKILCSDLLQGQRCYDPDTVKDHADYAFNEYYHQMGMASGSCYFNGVAVVSTTDPSHAPCIFFGRGGKNGTFNGTSLAPSSNSSAEVSELQDQFAGSVSVIKVIGVLLSSLLIL